MGFIKMGFCDEIIFVVVFGTVVMIAIFIYLFRHISKKKNEITSHLDSLENFSVAQKFLSSDGSTGIAIDENRQKVCLIENKQGQVSCRVFPYKDLLSSEICESGTIITKTQRSSQVGGTLIGGIALGGVGAIIGGLSGKTKTLDKVNSVGLRITANDTKNPVFYLEFLDFASMIEETAKGDILHMAAIKEAQHWHALISILIKQADEEDNKNVSKIASSEEVRSVAVEIKKLAELRDAGILTDEEFQKQKSKVLGS